MLPQQLMVVSSSQKPCVAIPVSDAIRGCAATPAFVAIPASGVTLVDVVAVTSVLASVLAHSRLVRQQQQLRTAIAAAAPAVGWSGVVPIAMVGKPADGSVASKIATAELFKPNQLAYLRCRRNPAALFMSGLKLETDEACLNGARNRF